MLLVIAKTASAASCTESNDATTVDAGGCAGIKRNVISVMMPRVPSLPTNSLVSESPATVLEKGTSEADSCTVRQHDPESENVVGGNSVLDAAESAGVGGCIAADGTDLEGRRVRWVPESVFCGCFLDLGHSSNRAA